MVVRRPWRRRSCEVAAAEEEEEKEKKRVEGRAARNG